MPETSEPTAPAKRSRRSPVKASEGFQSIAYRDNKLRVSCKTPTGLVRSVEIDLPKGCPQEALHKAFLSLADEYKPVAVPTQGELPV